VLRAVHAGGRLAGALHGDHRPRPHDVRRDQVDGSPPLRGEPGDTSRGRVREQRPHDRGRPQRGRADVRADLLGGRADRVGGRRHTCPRHRSEHPRWGPGGPDHALRGWHRPALHEDRRARRAGAVAPRALPQAHARLGVLHARRAHATRRLPHDPRRRRAGAGGGGHAALQGVQSGGHRGGQALVQGTHPGDDDPGSLSLARSG
jgi:hypothetical protein